MNEDAHRVKGKLFKIYNEIKLCEEGRASKKWMMNVIIITT